MHFMFHPSSGIPKTPRLNGVKGLAQPVSTSFYHPIVFFKNNCGMRSRIKRGRAGDLQNQTKNIYIFGRYLSNWGHVFEVCIVSTDNL